MQKMWPYNRETGVKGGIMTKVNRMLYNVEYLLTYNDALGRLRTKREVDSSHYKADTSFSDVKDTIRRKYKKRGEGEIPSQFRLINKRVISFG
jgi:hypothetical protein